MYVLFDYDDCTLGEIWPSAMRPRRPLNRKCFGKILSLLDELGWVGIGFSGRSPAQQALLGHVLGGRYHIAEWGASAWIPYENRKILNPQFEDFARNVRPQMLFKMRNFYGGI